VTLHIVGGTLKLEGTWYAVQMAEEPQYIAALFKRRDLAEAWAKDYVCRQFTIIELIADGEP
jgi:hypothetical protein